MDNANQGIVILSTLFSRMIKAFHLIRTNPIFVIHQLPVQLLYAVQDVCHYTIIDRSIRQLDPHLDYDSIRDFSPLSSFNQVYNKQQSTIV